MCACVCVSFYMYALCHAAVSEVVGALVGQRAEVVSGVSFIIRIEIA